jgi:hypothetical protein
MVRAVNLGKLAVWQERLLRFGKSRQTINEFCREGGFSLQSFYLWRKRVAKNSVSVGSAKRLTAGQSFVPVRLTATAVMPIVICLPNGVRVRLSGDNVEALRAGIEAAGVLPVATSAAGKETTRC